MNTSLAVKWQSFESEVVLQNSNLNEFNGYYIALRTSAHEMLLSGNTLNFQVIGRDNTAIKDGAKQCIIATESFKERCFTLLAEIELGAKRWKEFDFTTITLQEVKDNIEKLHSFKPSVAQLTKYVSEELRPVYIAENVFKVAAKS